MTEEKMTRVRQLMSANRTFGDIERDEDLALHEVGWCSWLRNEDVGAAVLLFNQMTLEIKPPFGKNGLAWLRQRDVRVE